MLATEKSKKQTEHRHGDPEFSSIPTQFQRDHRHHAQAQCKLQQQADTSIHATKTSQLANIVQCKSNNSGLPAQLKSGIEHLSGYAMHDVSVHYNSSKPAQLKAHAFAQGTSIHLAPGQECHLPHEAWHVVQQKQGRVKPTVQMKSGMNVNDDPGLEREADVMGAKASAMHLSDNTSQLREGPSQADTTQLKTGFEMELHVPIFSTAPAARKPNILKQDTALSNGEKEEISKYLGGGLIYGQNYGTDTQDRFDITADHGADQGPHRLLINKLEEKNYISKFTYRSMTNIEYRTPPVEEREKGATERVNNIAEAVKAHAADAAGKSTGSTVSSLNSPAVDLHTGVPLTALYKLASTDNEIKGLANAAKSAVKPFVYFQTNTGVLPSEIPSLFREAQQQIGTEHLLHSNPKTDAMQYLLHGSIRAGEVMQDDIKQALAKMNENEIAYQLLGPQASDVTALKGWVTLVAQYLFAYQLEQSNFNNTNSASKNLVGYMSKTPILLSLQALPKTARPFIDNTATGQKWETLFTKLVNTIEQQGLVATAKLTPSLTTPSKVLGANALAWITKILKGEQTYTVQSGRPLGLDGDQEVQEGDLNIPGEQAIVMEDRWAHLKMKNSDVTDMDKIDTLMKGEWALAVNRRKKSTKGDVDYAGQNAQEASIYYALVKSVRQWLTTAAKPHFNIPEVTRNGWDTRLNANNPLLDLDETKHAGYIVALKTLRKDIIEVVNQKQKDINDNRHEWIVEAGYMDGIMCNWKDSDNYVPVLQIRAPGVYVKIAGSWSSATQKDGYFQYKHNLTWTKIKRRVGGVTTYYKIDNTWGW